MEPPKLGKARKSRDCDITAELDSCKKMMAYLASEDGDGHDVQLILKDGTEIPAHSFILRLRSEKLRTKVDEAKAEGLIKPYPINIDEDVDKEDFAVFVRFLYLYEVSKELTPKLRHSLVLLARKYLVVGLEDYCRSFLKENISCKNVLLFLEEAIQQNLDNSIGQVQQECLDIISVDQTIFHADSASLRDITPRILKRIVALPKLPVSEEGLFLFLIKWKEYHHIDKDDSQLTNILELVRFPCMRGQFLADVVQPTGLVKMDALADYPCTPREVATLLNVRTSQLGSFTIEYNSKDGEAEIRRKVDRMMGVAVVPETKPTSSRVYRIFFKGNLMTCGKKSLAEMGVKFDDALEIVSLLVVVVKAHCGQSWSFEIFDNDTVGALKREFAKVIGESPSKIVFALDVKGDRDDLTNVLNDKDTIAAGNVKNGDTIRFSRVGGKRLFGNNLCDQGGGGGAAEGKPKKNGVAFASSYLCSSVTKPENGFKTTKDSWSSSKLNWTQPQWIGYAFYEPKVINRISFLGANNPADTPVAYQFQGSNDGKEWTNIFEIEKGPLCNTKREFRSHEFENGTPYTQYRLHISQVQWARIAASAGKSVDSIKGFVAVSSLQFFEAKRK